MSIRTAILAYDTIALFELSCAVELFLLPRREYSDWYEGQVLSISRGPIATTGNLQLLVDTKFDLSQVDFLVVPSWPVDGQALEDSIADQIRQFHKSGKRIISFCSGSFLLAQLGVLDGRVAVSHWRYSEAFRRRFPHIPYRDDILYSYDGVIGCSAGSAAAIDLGLAVIRGDYGYKRANEVARRLVLPAHRQGGQAQYTETPMLDAENSFSQSLDWATARLKERISIDRWSEKANMSRRNFDRRFRTSTGMSPNNWLILQRIELAKSLLETSGLSLDQIAHECGFGTTLNMNKHFKKHLTCTAKTYQRQFAAV